MKPACRSPPALRKDLLTVLPGRMVNAKPTISLNQPLPRPLVHTLNSLELSNIDQLYDDYTSIALFYERGSVNSVTILRGALEELLVHFPAAAGRLRFNELEGRLEVEYYSSAPSPANDTLQASGVQFVAAHADIAFSELGDVSAPHSSFDLLHPTLLKDSCQGSSGNLRPYPIVAIQVTTFTCGGFTLALMSNHAFMDGHGAAVFLQNLCSIARGKGVVSPPETFSRRDVMKPRMPPSPTFGHPYIASAPGGLQFGNATRFTFSAAALEALRLKGSGQAMKQCSRFQALVALLWTAQAKSVAVAGGTRRRSEEFPIRLPVNLRERVVPTLTRGYTGNGTLQCMVTATVQELCESSLECVVQKIKAAMASITPEYAQSETDYVELQLRAGGVPHLDHSCLAMPCLVHLPFYDTDCGWGRPVYCGRPSKEPFQRIFVLDHPTAGAWNVLNTFHSDEERAAFQEAIAEYTIDPHEDEKCAAFRDAIAEYTSNNTHVVSLEEAIEKYTSTRANGSLYI